MDICKNNSSGKYFILLECIDNDKALIISPQGKISILELCLFEEEEMADEDYLLSDGLITRKQIKRYYDYHEIPLMDVEMMMEISYFLPNHKGPKSHESVFHISNFRISS